MNVIPLPSPPRAWSTLFARVPEEDHPLGNADSYISSNQWFVCTLG